MQQEENMKQFLRLSEYYSAISSFNIVKGDIFNRKCKIT